MRKLITKKDFNEMVKYHSQMDGYKFNNSVEDYSISIVCHHKDGNKLTICNDTNGNGETCYFEFNDLTFEQFNSYISRLFSVLDNKQWDNEE